MRRARGRAPPGGREHAGGSEQEHKRIRGRGGGHGRWRGGGRARGQEIVQQGPVGIGGRAAYDRYYTRRAATGVSIYQVQVYFTAGQTGFILTGSRLNDPARVRADLPVIARIVESFRINAPSARGARAGAARPPRTVGPHPSRPAPASRALRRRRRRSARDARGRGGGRAGRTREVAPMGNVGNRVRHAIERPAREVVERFRDADPPDLADAMNKSGAMREILPMSTCVGPALTVKVPTGDALMIRKAMSLAQSGDVIVIDGRGAISRSLWGGNRSAVVARGERGGRHRGRRRAGRR